MDETNEILLEELGERIDRKRVHLFGRMPHDRSRNFIAAVIYTYISLRLLY